VEGLTSHRNRSVRAATGLRHPEREHHPRHLRLGPSRRIRSALVVLVSQRARKRE